MSFDNFLRLEKIALADSTDTEIEMDTCVTDTFETLIFTMKQSFSQLFKLLLIHSRDHHMPFKV